MFNWIQRLGEELDRCLSGKTRYQFVIWRRMAIKDAFQDSYNLDYVCFF